MESEQPSLRSVVHDGAFGMVIDSSSWIFRMLTSRMRRHTSRALSSPGPDCGMPPELAHRFCGHRARVGGHGVSQPLSHKAINGSLSRQLGGGGIPQYPEVV